MNKRKLVTAMSALLFTQGAFAADLDITDEYGAIAFERFWAQQSSSLAPIASGGNVELGQFTLGYGQPSAPAKDYIVSGREVYYYYGNQPVGSIISAGGGYVSDDVKTSMEAGSEIKHYDNNLPIDMYAERQELTELSTELSALAQTGNVFTQHGVLYLQGDKSDSTQVFNITTEQLNAASDFQVYDVSLDATIIINISGDVRSAFMNKTMASLQSHKDKTVFNFFETRELNISNLQFEGVLLAPYAQVNTDRSVYHMPVIANHFYAQYSVDIRHGKFNGELPGDKKPVDKINAELAWKWTGGSFMPESNQVMITPVVAQLNDDNRDGYINSLDTADVVVVTFTGNQYTKPGLVRALSGVDGTELWTYQNGGVFATAEMSPAIADLDNDGIVEIVVTDRTDKVTVIDNLGNVKKEFTKSNKRHSNVTISDIDSDGTPEIMTANDVFDYRYGRKFSHSADSWTFGTIAFDSDLDNQQEVLAAGELRDHNGALLWKFDADSTAWFSSVGNFDNDITPEIVVSVPSSDPTKNKIALLEHNGNVIWQTNNVDNVGGGVQAISNFFDKDKVGIVYAGYNAVDMFNAQGEKVWSVANDDVWSGKVGVSAYDFTGDGLDEVLVQDHMKVRILDGATGKELTNIPNSSGTLWEFPIVVDLAGDNNAEMITVSNDYDSRWKVNHGVYVYKSADANKPWQNATRIWNQHSYHQTNIYQNGQVPRIEFPSWLNNNSYRSSTMR